jgi:hypothetical protein
MGDRCPDLSPLPEDMAEEVAGMLERLKTTNDERRKTNDE